MRKKSYVYIFWGVEGGNKLRQKLEILMIKEEKICGRVGCGIGNKKRGILHIFLRGGNTANGMNTRTNGLTSQLLK